MLTTATGKPRVTGFHCRQLDKAAYKALKSFMALTGGYHRGGSSDLHPILSLGLAASPRARAPNRDGLEVEGPAAQRGDQHPQLYP